MPSFQHIVEEQGMLPYQGKPKYSPAGKTYFINNDEIEGTYWFYESEQFIIDIHDIFIKKALFSKSFPDMRPYMSFISNYIKSANGEFLHPYQTLTSNTVFVMNAAHGRDDRILLHANSPYISIGINFKTQMMEEYLQRFVQGRTTTISDIFFETRERLTKPIEKLANAIVECTMESYAAAIFFEAKAKEWLSITLDEYIKNAHEKPLSKSDEEMIEDVANYINDHYSMDIPQSLLEKIAMMSGTKLKNVFKQKYRMSITEYTQKRRMNIAETLLTTTQLDIKTIAKSVGYRSHSRFSSLFKKYRGIYPHELIARLSKKKIE